MKPVRATSVNLSGDTSARQTAWEIVQEAAKADPLLKAALDRRCERGFDCQRGPHDPPRRCAACTTERIVL